MGYSSFISAGFADDISAENLNLDLHIYIFLYYTDLSVSKAMAMKEHFIL